MTISKLHAALQLVNAVPDEILNIQLLWKYFRVSIALGCPGNH